MVVPRMHADEVAVDGDLVARLLDGQCPDLAGLPLRRVEAWGTDHALFRLGDDLAVRLPRIGWAAGQAEATARWLPRLGPHLPVEVPAPVLVGRPAEGYPFAWSVVPWLAGTTPAAGDDEGLARDLARFVGALQAIDITGAPIAGPDDRGGPLAAWDQATRARAEELRDETDVDALLAIWAEGVDAPPWRGPPVWVHRDLSDGNLLVRGGRLSAVIDWGGVRAGDPAVELLAAWTTFGPVARQVYRAGLPWADDAAWARGRAWAVSAVVLALPYYRDTNPDIVARSWRAVDALLADRA